MNTNDEINLALNRAGQVAANRRVVVALIAESTVDWWGGSIDDWAVDEALLTSSAVLNDYRQLVRAFRMRSLSTGHAVIVYRNGSYASVMLGIRTLVEANRRLVEAMELVRIRSGGQWLRI
ncbi:hypothetical protein QYH69_35435 [Paraburkholderia sp. SARCC-3016]|uniref:hypothetical protein n=1 Tax=Paraburkholderia sp. SARCC-3016 TaxID=3058611 RepID=UPI002806E72B|nr:hypothetical protein [Paraburkholderia sp. SARCC-3016]MDQ7982503.1 hypothetical protein [Paraburkholderia sp. SARCC-3016]